jgi:thioredoxin reductase (NADPH)
LRSPFQSPAAPRHPPPIPGLVLAARPLGPGGPLPFETSIPGVFAVGDVRSGSMKRVAAATGEGASAIASVHKAIAALA